MKFVSIIDYFISRAKCGRPQKEDDDVKENVRHSEGATATEESPEVSTYFVATLGDPSATLVPRSAQDDIRLSATSSAGRK